MHPNSGKKAAPDAGSTTATIPFGDYTVAAHQSAPTATPLSADDSAKQRILAFDQANKAKLDEIKARQKAAAEAKKQGKPPASAESAKTEKPAKPPKTPKAKNTAKGTRDTKSQASKDDRDAANQLKRDNLARDRARLKLIAEAGKMGRPARDTANRRMGGGGMGRSGGGGGGGGGQGGGGGGRGGGKGGGGRAKPVTPHAPAAKMAKGAPARGY